MFISRCSSESLKSSVPIVTAVCLGMESGEWSGRVVYPRNPLDKTCWWSPHLSARQIWYFYWQTDWNLALSRPGSGANSGQFFIASRSCKTKQKVSWSMNHGVLQIAELPYLCRAMWPAGSSGSRPALSSVICPIVSNYVFYLYAIGPLSVNLLRRY